MAAALEVPTGQTVNSELLRVAFEGSPEGLAIIENNRILRANAVLARLLGYDQPSRLEGVALSALRPRRHSCIRTGGCDAPRTADGHPLCEFTTKRKDGSTITLEATCSAVRYAERDPLILTGRDISLRERRFRAIFDAAAIGIVQCAADGRILESNPAAERLPGFTRSELRGRRLWEFTHPENPGDDQQLFQEMVASGPEIRGSRAAERVERDGHRSAALLRSGIESGRRAGGGSAEDSHDARTHVRQPCQLPRLRKESFPQPVEPCPFKTVWVPP
jgi:PAS domain S-box-containing protein